MKIDRLAQIQQFLKDEPDNPELKYFLAMEHLSRKEYGNALSVFQGIFELHPDYIANYYQYGLLLFESGKFAESKTVLEQGISKAAETGNQKAVSELNELLEDVKDEL